MPFLELPALIPVDESGPRTIWLSDRPWAFKDEKTGKLYVFPGNYLTDLASLPRIPLIWLSFGGRAAAASAGHDVFYSDGMRLKMIEDRAEADWVYLQMMLATKVPERIAYSMYHGVRDYGEPYFHG